MEDLQPAMKKLQAVRKALRENDGIVVLEHHSEVSLPDRYVPGGHPWAAFIRIYAAPATPICSVEALQEMMMGLVPDVGCHADDFHGFLNGDMRPGNLYFDECIGTSQHVHIIDTPGVKLPEDWVDGRITLEERILCRTLVSFFPSVSLMQATHAGELSQGSIKVADLARFGVRQPVC